MDKRLRQYLLHAQLEKLETESTAERPQQADRQHPIFHLTRD